MKKLIILMVFSLSFSTSAFAATGTAANGVGTVGGETLTATAPATLDIGRASKGVVFGWNTSATGYAINTYHLQGTKFYGTAYDSTALYFNDVGTDATLVAPTSSVAGEAFPSADWTTM
jgi:hypothetical protein